MTAPIILKASRLAEWSADDAFGTRMLSQKRRAGRITGAADLGWITYRGTGGNPDPGRQPGHIGKLDHAEAIVALARLDATLAERAATAVAAAHTAAQRVTALPA